MFFDIGSLEFLFLIVLAIMVFGPEKLPKMIQDAAGFLRKIRDFSDSAKQDIRNELGPEFKDFEFEDLNPRRFAKKHLMDNDDLGLKELTNSLDMRKELSEVTDAVNGRPANGSRSSRLSKGAGAAGSVSTAKDTAASATPTSEGAATQVSLAKEGDAKPAAAPREEPPPPFDADAT
ncbi:sec-independent translocase [Streptomyces sp. B6B3]|uniref:sec-independent translocase n=1 Tax=Streptomyces sp. B6B3 TaxID=3153570 RepID=UPI00325ECC9C